MVKDFSYYTIFFGYCFPAILFLGAVFLNAFNDIFKGKDRLLKYVQTFIFSIAVASCFFFIKNMSYFSAAHWVVKNQNSYCNGGKE